MAQLTAEQLTKLKEQRRAIDAALKLASKTGKTAAAQELAEKRAKDRERKNTRQASISTVHIPPCEDRERRELLESDDEEWLRYYFGPGCGLQDTFTFDFTADQRDMIRSIRHAIVYGGDQAIAAPRGNGKTTYAERLALKALLTGEINYAVIFAATGPMADGILESIKTYLTENVLLLADYPEVCVPAIALESTPQRAKTQKASGKRHDNGEPYEQATLEYQWSGDAISFPRTPGSPSAGAAIKTKGLEGAVRGIRHKGKRPQLALIDDPDTEITANSEEQAKKLSTRIDAAIGGLGGQRRSIGRVMLTTIQSRVSCSWIYTDAKKKPWKGRRYRFLVTPPERQDLWDEYIQMRLEDLQRRDENGIDLDPFARRSHNFYLAHRELMDAGAVVSNPNRMNATITADGSQEEVSALEHYFNLVARLGPEAVATEYNNDPPEIEQAIETGLAPSRIQRQVSGYDRCMVPPDCIVLTQGIDVRKVALHWVVRAWRADGSGFVVDYGIHEVLGTKYGSDEGLDEAVRKSILDRMEATKNTEYMTPDGELRDVDLTLVDAGWRTDAVYAACHEVGLGIMPVMGFGKSSGCTQANFSEINRRTLDKKPGDGWFLSRKGKLWLVAADADRWKTYEHDRWMTSPGRPGSLQMFGVASDDRGGRMSDDEKSHHSYARHICNESEIEEMHKGTLRRRWRAKSENTHWLDASYYANVAASIKGIRLARTAPSKANDNTTTGTAAATIEQAAQVAVPAVAGGQTAANSPAAGNWYAQARRIKGRA